MRTSHYLIACAIFLSSCASQTIDQPARTVPAALLECQEAPIADPARIVTLDAFKVYVIDLLAAWDDCHEKIGRISAYQNGLEKR